MKTSYLLIALMITACTTEADETVNPAPQKEIENTAKIKSSARIAAECEELVATNGLVINECQIGLGGTITSEISIDGGFHMFDVYNTSTLQMMSFQGQATYGSYDGDRTAFLYADSPDRVSMETRNADKKSEINVKVDGIRIQTNNGRVEIWTGNPGNEKRRLWINKAGEIMMNLNATAPSKGLYIDANGFVKQQP